MAPCYGPKRTCDNFEIVVVTFFRTLISCCRGYTRYADRGMEADGESPGQSLPRLVSDRRFPNDLGASGLNRAAAW